MVDRIGDDHVTARELAGGLAAIDGLAIDPTQVQTNIVLVDLAERLGKSERVQLGEIRPRRIAGVQRPGRLPPRIAFHPATRPD